MTQIALTCVEEKKNVCFSWPHGHSLWGLGCPKLTALRWTLGRAGLGSTTVVTMAVVCCTFTLQAVPPMHGLTSSDAMEKGCLFPLTHK